MYVKKKKGKKSKGKKGKEWKKDGEKKISKDLGLVKLIIED